MINIHISQTRRLSQHVAILMKKKTFLIQKKPPEIQASQ